MFTAFGCIDMTFIFNFYHQNMCPTFNINIQKSERALRKHKLKTGTIIRILIILILKLNTILTIFQFV